MWLKLIAELEGDQDQFLRLLSAAVLERRGLGPENAYPTVPDPPHVEGRLPIVEIAYSNGTVQPATLDDAEDTDLYRSEDLVPQWADDRYVIESGGTVTAMRASHERLFRARRSGTDLLYWRFSFEPNLWVPSLRFQIEADAEISRVLRVAAHSYILEIMFRRPLRRGNAVRVSTYVAYEAHGAFAPWIRRHVLVGPSSTRLSVEFAGDQEPGRVWWQTESEAARVAETYVASNRLRPNIVGQYQKPFGAVEPGTNVLIAWEWGQRA